jgi:hypothetical protein
MYGLYYLLSYHENTTAVETQIFEWMTKNTEEKYVITPSREHFWIMYLTNKTPIVAEWYYLIGDVPPTNESIIFSNSTEWSNALNAVKQKYNVSSVLIYWESELDPVNNTAMQKRISDGEMELVRNVGSSWLAKA